MNKEYYQKCFHVTVGVSSMVEKVTQSKNEMVISVNVVIECE